MDYKSICKDFISLLEEKRFKGLKDLRDSNPGIVRSAETRLAVLDELEFDAKKMCGMQFPVLR